MLSDKPASPSKLGRYITSKAFSDRVGEVVKEAIRDLESRGITPVYDRQAPAQSDKQEPPCATDSVDT